MAGKLKGLSGITKKKKVLTDGPKRPLTSYFLFLEDNRQKVKESSPEGTPVHEIAIIIGKMWKKLKPEEKEVYTKRAAANKAIYLEQVAELKKKQEEAAAAMEEAAEAETAPEEETETEETTEAETQEQQQAESEVAGGEEEVAEIEGKSEI